MRNARLTFPESLLLPWCHLVYLNGCARARAEIESKAFSSNAVKTGALSAGHRCPFISSTLRTYVVMKQMFSCVKACHLNAGEKSADACARARVVRCKSPARLLAGVSRALLRVAREARRAGEHDLCPYEVEIPPISIKVVAERAMHNAAYTAVGD